MFCLILFLSLSLILFVICLLFEIITINQHSCVGKTLNLNSLNLGDTCFFAFFFLFP